MGAPRRYQEAEYTRTEGEPLSPERLASIWKGLAESERFGFVLSLDETLADSVIELCKLPATPAESRNPMPQPKRLALLEEPVERKQTTTRSAAAIVADSERAVARAKAVLASVAVKRPTALSELDALATKRSAATKQTQAQAFAEVLAEQPELYDRYSNELAAGLYTEPAPAATKKSFPVNALLDTEVRREMAEYHLAYADALAKVARETPALYRAAELEH